jgi:hypothetical protein
MTCSSCPPEIEKFGADPANIQWKVVRGDTSSIRVEFWEDDEVTPIDTDGWTYIATAYNGTTGTSYELDTDANDNYVDITAYPVTTEEWGSGYSSVVAELTFDLEITKTNNTVWTPVIGTICVLGDTTLGGSL